MLKIFGAIFSTQFFVHGGFFLRDNVFHNKFGRLLRLGNVILNVLNEKRRSLPFLCHYSPQMPLIISEKFYNMINAQDRTFKSMLRLCQYSVLKRMCEFDAKSVIPCYEAF